MFTNFTRCRRISADINACIYKTIAFCFRMPEQSEGGQFQRLQMAQN